jgi:putative ABC transport system permease protein
MATYLRELLQDVAFTWRQLARNPGFTAVAVLTLALGIGATTAIFSAVYAVVLQPLPLADPARLMLVGEIYDGAPRVMSVGNYVDANEAVPDFEHGLAAFNSVNFNLADETAPERVVGARVTANYFDVLGVAPRLGRGFTPKRTGRATIAWWCSAIVCGRGASAPAPRRSAGRFA